MNRQAEAQSFLDQLSDRLGIGTAELGDDRAATVRCNVEEMKLDVHVLLHEDGETLALSVALAPLPTDEERQAELVSALMAANLLGSATKGLVLSVSPKDRRVHLGYSLIWPGATYEAFEAAFARIVTYGVEWRKKLELVRLQGGA